VVLVQFIWMASPYAPAASPLKQSQRTLKSGPLKDWDRVDYIRFNKPGWKNKSLNVDTVNQDS
jgi:hypothetical protein